MKLRIWSVVALLGCAHTPSDTSDAWELSFSRTTAAAVRYRRPLEVRSDGTVCWSVDDEVFVGQLEPEVTSHLWAVLADEALPWGDLPRRRRWRRDPMCGAGCTRPASEMSVTLEKRGQRTQTVRVVRVGFDNTFYEGDAKLASRLQKLRDYFQLVAEDSTPIDSALCR